VVGWARLGPTQSAGASHPTTDLVKKRKGGGRGGILEGNLEGGVGASSRVLLVAGAASRGRGGRGPGVLCLALFPNARLVGRRDGETDEAKLASNLELCGGVVVWLLRQTAGEERERGGEVERGRERGRGEGGREIEREREVGKKMQDQPPLWERGRRRAKSACGRICFCTWASG
jgi:hypothetical protein